MSNNGNPRLNNSGCPDPTAYEAMKNIQAEEKMLNHVDDTAHILVTTIKNVLDLAGFELVERIQIRHKRSGKIFR